MKKHNDSKEVKILLAWQWVEAMEKLPQGTIVMIPEHAVNKNFQKIHNKVTLIKISGVLHTRDLKNIQKENDGLIDERTEMIVMLAGDTQQEDGSWAQYTSQMAQELLKGLPVKKEILFLNGPRTGKHRKIGGCFMPHEQAHRTEVDDITKIVMEKSCPNKQWKVVDFKFGQESLWGPALKFCLKNPKVLLILPGESTSMISEALTLGIRPIIYLHNAMTKDSLNYVLGLVRDHKAMLYGRQYKNDHCRQEPLELQGQKVIEKLEHLCR